MSLKFAVLGLLTERRSYGYELVQRLTERLGPAWQLNPSAVYGALDQLEDGGLIRETAAHGVNGGTRRRTARVIYEATECGECAFARWMANPAQRQEPVRSELRLKLVLATAEHVPALLDAIEREHWRVRVLQQRVTEHAASSSPSDSSGWSGERAELAQAAAAIRLDAELSWLRHARVTLEQTGVSAVSRDRTRFGVVSD